MTTATQYTVTVRGTDVTFTSAFDNLELAYFALAGAPNPSQFAQDLLAAARARKLSLKQAAWIHKLATDLVRPTPDADAAVAGVDATQLVQLLRNAQADGKHYPKIRVPHEDGTLEVALSDKRPGFVAVVRTGRYPDSQLVARIDAAGRVHLAHGWTSSREATIRAVAANPQEELAKAGLRTGTCCYCSRPLTAAESVHVGYGPICAARFGLPWGGPLPQDPPALELFQ